MEEREIVEVGKEVFCGWDGVFVYKEFEGGGDCGGGGGTGDDGGNDAFGVKGLSAGVA